VWLSSHPARRSLHAPLVVSLAAALCSCGLALSGCNGPATGLSPAAPSQRSAALTPSRGAIGAASPIPFAFQTVDDPASNVNEVTGIDALGDIVGTIGSGTPSSPFTGYSSTIPYTSFTAQWYSGGQGTVAMGVATNTIMAGYVIHPPQLPGIWAFVEINGLWTLIKDRKGGKGTAAVTEILGVNTSKFGVGFYKNAYGNNVPVVLNIPLENFNTLKPPGAISAEGTGINTVNDVSGWESTSGGTVGFLVRAGTYYSISYPGSTTTEALGLNSQDQIVGYYQQSNGTKHGFILTNPTKAGQQVWQTIDEPNAVSGTVVTGINDSDDVCGYYVDGNGVQHGFVAVP
jgi:hypothetical protein